MNSEFITKKISFVHFIEVQKNYTKLCKLEIMLLLCVEMCIQYNDKQLHISSNGINFFPQCNSLTITTKLAGCLELGHWLALIC